MTLAGAIAPFGSRVIEGYLILLAAVAMLIAIRLLARTTASARPHHTTQGSLESGSHDASPLLETERLVDAARASAGAMDRRLRPALREIAAGRLRSQGIDLQRDPERARMALSEPLWQLISPDAPPPEDRRAPGLQPAELDPLLAEVEQL